MGTSESSQAHIQSPTNIKIHLDHLCHMYVLTLNVGLRTCVMGSTGLLRFRRDEGPANSCSKEGFAALR